MSRFVLVEVEGFATPTVKGSQSVPGLTVSVLDADYAHREVARFRSEEHRWHGGFPTRAETRAHVRGLAAAKARELNALDGAA